MDHLGSISQGSNSLSTMDKVLLSQIGPTETEQGGRKTLLPIKELEESVSKYVENLKERRKERLEHLIANTIAVL